MHARHEQRSDRRFHERPAIRHEQHFCSRELWSSASVRRADRIGDTTLAVGYRSFESSVTRDFGIQGRTKRIAKASAIKMITGQNATWPNL